MNNFFERKNEKGKNKSTMTSGVKLSSTYLWSGVQTLWRKGDLVLCEATSDSINSPFVPYKPKGSIHWKQQFATRDLVVDWNGNVWGVLDAETFLFVKADGNKDFATDWWVACRAPTPADAESDGAKQVNKHIAFYMEELERLAEEKKKKQTTEQLDGVLKSLMECDQARPKMLDAVVGSLSKTELLAAMHKIVARLSDN